MRDLFGGALNRIPELESTVLLLFYKEKMTVVEIAKHLNLHESRVAQIKLRALLKLRSYVLKEFSQSESSAERPAERRNPASPYLLPQTTSGNGAECLLDDPVIQTLMAAASAFPSLQTVRSWLLTPNAALANEAPVSLLSTEAGREILTNELGLIEHGMF